MFNKFASFFKRALSYKAATTSNYLLSPSFSYPYAQAYTSSPLSRRPLASVPVRRHRGNIALLHNCAQGYSNLQRRLFTVQPAMTNASECPLRITDPTPTGSITNTTTTNISMDTADLFPFLTGEELKVFDSKVYE